MADFDKGIVSVRLHHPRGKGEIDVVFSPKDRRVDAVFITVDAVEKILLPFYRGRNAAQAEDLLRRVREQQDNGYCFVPHQYSCKVAVPPIDWNAPSPIVLGPCDWAPADGSTR